MFRYDDRKTLCKGLIKLLGRHFVVIIERERETLKYLYHVVMVS